MSTLLHCNIHVIETKHQHKSFLRLNMLLKKEDWMPDGYRSLIPLQHDAPVPLIDITEEDTDKYTRGEDGVIYSLHTYLHNLDPTGVMHGPAWSSKGSGGWPDEDWVNAYYSPHWPEECSQWERRVQIQSEEGDISGKRVQIQTEEGDLSGKRVQIQTEEGDLSGKRVQIQTEEENQMGNRLQLRTTECTQCQQYLNSTIIDSNQTKLNEHISHIECKCCVKKNPNKAIRATKSKCTDTCTHWPSEELQQSIINSGCFVIPVSHKVIMKPTLYRLSTTFAERILIMNFNLTQKWTLVILKLLIKTNMTGNNEDRMKSFFLKTAVFYASEKYGMAIWKEDSIVKCVQICLKWMIGCLDRNRMPHYFQPNLDMFEGRFDEETKESVRLILNDILQDTRKALKDISFDNFGDRLCKRLEVIPDAEYKPSQTSYIEHKVKIGHFLSNLYIDNFPYDYNNLLKRDEALEFKTHVDTLEKRIAICKTIQSSDDCIEYKRIAANRFETLLSTTLAFLQTVQHKEITTEALELFKHGLLSDPAAGRLKFATALYGIGNPTECLRILKEAEHHYDMNNTIPVCLCYRRTKVYRPKETFELNCIERINDGTLRDYCAFCVVFLPNENELVPEELKFEYKRLTENELLELNEKQTYMKWASVDSLPYLYFLMFKVYRDLENVRCYDGRSYTGSDESGYKGELKHNIENAQIDRVKGKRGVNETDELEKSEVEQKKRKLGDQESIGILEVTKQQHVVEMKDQRVEKDTSKREEFCAEGWDEEKIDIAITEFIEGQKRALDLLGRCIDTENLNHRETALNLLGQCQEIISAHADAAETYKRSLQESPDCNAARILYTRLTEKFKEIP